MFWQVLPPSATPSPLTSSLADGQSASVTQVVLQAAWVLFFKHSPKRQSALLLHTTPTSRLQICANGAHVLVSLGL
jgi:hypothetical protein